MRLKINAIKIEVYTSEGLYGVTYPFKCGLNIIRGNNTSGKSTLSQSILYALGLEELLGGRNSQTMQSVLKDMIEYPKNKFLHVTQSIVYLEIVNNENQVITIKRSIKSPDRDDKLVDVYSGALITENAGNLIPKSMYLHDSGGASNNYFGFHKFLEQFLGWHLPEVYSSNGTLSKLYIQQVASAFLIEQKSGWSDFLSTMPYYNIKNAEAKVIEFLLNLDVFKNEKRKLELNLKKRQIEELWQEAFSKLSALAKTCGGEVYGISNQPMILTPTDFISIEILDKEIKGNSLNIKDYARFINEKLEDFKIETNNQDNFDKIEMIERELQKSQDEYNIVVATYERVQSEVSNKDRQKYVYLLQINKIQEDLEKNEGAKKVKALGSRFNISIAEDQCPTCHQNLSGVLLPQTIKQSPMTLDDNIKFLNAQLNMLESSYQTIRKEIDQKTKEEEQLKQLANKLADQIRVLRREFISDERLPSKYILQQQIELENKLKLFERVIKEYDILLETFSKISEDYNSYVSAKSELPEKKFTNKDWKTYNSFQSSFKSLIKSFNYQSKKASDIFISLEKYIPVAKTEELVYNIKFDSSGTDFIRCLWAYYISLMITSDARQGNHPGLLMFDEPKQQDLALEDFRVFLKTLEAFSNNQILVFASFENSEETFRSTVKNLVNFHYIKIDDKLIKPMSL